MVCWTLLTWQKLRMNKCEKMYYKGTQCVPYPTGRLQDLADIEQLNNMGY